MRVALLHIFKHVNLASSDKLILLQNLIMEIAILFQPTTAVPYRGNSDWGNKIIISDQNVRMSTDTAR